MNFKNRLLWIFAIFMMGLIVPNLVSAETLYSYTTPIGESRDMFKTTSQSSFSWNYTFDQDVEIHNITFLFYRYQTRTGSFWGQIYSTDANSKPDVVLANSTNSYLWNSISTSPSTYTFHYDNLVLNAGEEYSFGLWKGNMSLTNIKAGTLKITGYSSNNCYTEYNSGTSLWGNCINGIRPYIVIEGENYTAPSPSNDTTCSPYNISCFTNLNRNVTFNETSVDGIELSPDGTNMYISGNGLEGVTQYTLSNAFDVRTATYYGFLNMSTTDTSPTDMAFNNNGSYFYIMGNEYDEIYWYKLSTPYDITTATFIDGGGLPSAGYSGLDISDDGHYFYIGLRDTSVIRQYYVVNPYNVTGSMSLKETLDISSYVNDTMTGMDMSDNGDYLYFSDKQPYIMHQFDLSTSWNISTATYTDNLTTYVRPNGIWLNPNGTALYSPNSLSSFVFTYGIPQNEFSFINELPTNATTFASNEIPYTINMSFYYQSGEATTDCTLTFNDTDSVSETFPVTNQTMQINYTFTDQIPFDLYDFTLNCTGANYSAEETKKLYVFLDDIEPTVIIYEPISFTTITKEIENLTINVSVSDVNLLNTTISVLYPNGSVMLTNETFNETTSVNYSNILNFDDEPSGAYILNVIAKDGHTKNVIDRWSDINKAGDGYIVFGDCKIYPDSLLNKINDYGYVYDKDRYYWWYDYKGHDSTVGYFFECLDNSSVIYMPNSDYKGHFIDLNNDRWFDFETEQDYKTTIKKITKNKWKIQYHHVPNDDLYIKTESVGDLNIVEINRSFLVTNLFDYSEQYEDNFVENFPTSYNLTLSSVSSKINITHVWLEFNNSYYATTNPYGYTYRVSPLYMPEIDGEYDNIEHRWIIFYNNTRNYTTPYSNQSIYDYDVKDEIDSYISTHILNISVYDETNNEPIFLDVGLNIYFDNGKENVTWTKTYYSNHTIDFYMSPNSSIYDVPVNVYGNIQLSGIYNNQSYVANTITIPLNNPLNLYNDGSVYSYNAYAIGVGNSTTVTYNWKTTGYEDITGTMSIYRCGLNGTRTLVSSVPVTSGIATANIELLTAQYSYDILYNGIIYQEDAYYTCHAESLEERTFYVDVSEDLTPVTGLYMIDCLLTDNGNNTITMEWSSNPSDSSTITGCIVQQYTTISGNVENYRNCTNTSFSLTRQVPNIDVNNWIIGEITQGGIKGYCRNDISYANNNNIGFLMGSTLLFGVILLVMGLSLLYAGQSTESLFGAIVSLIIAYLLGIVALSWQSVTLIISVLIIIILIIRYNKND